MQTRNFYCQGLGSAPPPPQSDDLKYNSDPLWKPLSCPARSPLLPSRPWPSIKPPRPHLLPLQPGHVPSPGPTALWDRQLPIRLPFGDWGWRGQPLVGPKLSGLGALQVVKKKHRTRMLEFFIDAPVLAS